MAIRYEKDYLMRLMQNFFLALDRIVNARRNQEYEQVYSELEVTFMAFFERNLAFFEAMTPEEIVAFFKDDPYPTEKVEMVAMLLFEAGVDRECDLIVFVDAPFEARVGRVKATRGWDAAELERREKAQVPLEEKRQRSDDVLVNDGEPGALPGRVADLLQRIQGRVSRLGSH